jgi:hypothetical protein
MAARRATSVCIPVDAEAVVEFRRFGRRTPILVISSGHPAALITFTLPEPVEAGHVKFARALARSAARYAIEVERAWRGLPALAVTRPDRQAVA